MIANLLVAFVALLHLFFMVLEMFLWRKPTGRKIFGLTPEAAEMSWRLAANQGLYNGFLVAGLVWSLIEGDQRIKIFFLGCVIVAGIFGAATVKPKIFLVQSVPAIVALAAVLMSQS